MLCMRDVHFGRGLMSITKRHNMDVDKTVKDIHSLYRAISGTNDHDISLTFKSTAFGVSKPWITRVSNRECAHETYDGSLNGLLALLKKELADKVKATQQEAIRLQQTLSQMDN